MQLVSVYLMFQCHRICWDSISSIQNSNDKNYFIRTNYDFVFEFVHGIRNCSNRFRCVLIFFFFSIWFRICSVLGAQCSCIYNLQFTWLNAFSLQTVIHSLNWWKPPNTSGINNNWCMHSKFIHSNGILCILPAELFLIKIMFKY